MCDGLFLIGDNLHIGIYDSNYTHYACTLYIYIHIGIAYRIGKAVLKRKKMDLSFAYMALVL